MTYGYPILQHIVRFNTLTLKDKKKETDAGIFQYCVIYKYKFQL